MKRKIQSSIVLVLLAIGILQAETTSFNNQLLIFCVNSYREGFYQKTIDCINELLPSLKTSGDNVEACKFLGLSYGMLNQIETAKEYFKQAIDIDPGFEIDTLEFPPNITLIYNQVKLEKKVALLDSTTQGGKSANVNEKPRIILPAVYLSTTAIATGAAGYFFYKSYTAYNNYRNYRPHEGLTPQEIQDQIDSYYREHRNALIAGACCSAVVPVAVYLLLRKTALKKHAGLMGENGQFYCAWSF